MTKKQLAKAIKRERLKQGLGFTALSRLVPCGESVIRKAEEGACPSVILGDAILRALKVKLTIGYVRGRKILDIQDAA